MSDTRTPPVQVVKCQCGVEALRLAPRQRMMVRNVPPDAVARRCECVACGRKWTVFVTGGAQA
jgi:hypothetical protein